MLVKLTQDFIANQLQSLVGKNRIEFCDTDLPGLYIEVNASRPGQGIFRYRYKDSTGKTCHALIGSSNVVTRDIAFQRASTLREQVKLSIYPKAADKPAPSLTVSDLFEKHVFPYTLPRKRSHSRDVEMYNLRLKSAFGSKALSSVSRKEVQLFHTRLLEEKLAPATCDHYVKLLRSAFNHAVRWELIDKNPLAGIKLYNVDNRVDNVPDKEQLVTLLKVLQTDENRAVCRIALFLLATGARLSEALGAQYSMIDRQNRTWRIPARTSKSKRIRSVPLSDAALDVINQLDSAGTSEYLFISPKSGLPFTTIQKVWCRIKSKAGLPKLHLHDLRHCNASWMVSAGVSLFVVQDILGHSDPKITMRYSHVASETKLKASNTASEIIRASMPFNLGAVEVKPMEVASV